MHHERQRKEHETAEAVPLSEPNDPSTTSATEDAPMNSPVPKPQSILSPISQSIPSPVPQNISSPISQSIPFPISQSISSPVPQNISNPASQNIEPLPWISPSQPSSTLSSSADTRNEQDQGHRNAPLNLNPNNLTMNQALELFELLQSRRSAEAVRPPTVDAQQVEVAPRRAEPLSFMTLQTVEGIIDSTDIVLHRDKHHGKARWKSLSIWDTHTLRSIQ